MGYDEKDFITMQRVNGLIEVFLLIGTVTALAGFIYLLIGLFWGAL